MPITTTKKDEQPAQSFPLPVDGANNPPLSDTLDANETYPEVTKLFQDIPPQNIPPKSTISQAAPTPKGEFQEESLNITYDQLTKPKYATALPVPPEVIEKYRLATTKKEEEPVQSYPLPVDDANNPPLSDASVTEIFQDIPSQNIPLNFTMSWAAPTPKEEFQDESLNITYDQLTKPKHATALPAPPEVIEKYRLKYGLAELSPNQSSPPPKEPAVTAKSTTSTGEPCKIKSEGKMKPSPPRSSSKKAAKLRRKAPKVK